MNFLRGRDKEGKNYIYNDASGNGNGEPTQNAPENKKPTFREQIVSKFTQKKNDKGELENRTVFVNQPETWLQSKGITKQKKCELDLNILLNNIAQSTITSALSITNALSSMASSVILGTTLDGDEKKVIEAIQAKQKMLKKDGVNNEIYKLFATFIVYIKHPTDKMKKIVIDEVYDTNLLILEKVAKFFEKLLEHLPILRGFLEAGMEVSTIFPEVVKSGVEITRKTMEIAVPFLKTFLDNHAGEIVQNLTSFNKEEATQKLEEAIQKLNEDNKTAPLYTTMEANQKLKQIKVKERILSTMKELFEPTKEEEEALKQAEAPAEAQAEEPAEAPAGTGTGTGPPIGGALRKHVKNKPPKHTSSSKHNKSQATSTPTLKSKSKSKSKSHSTSRSKSKSKSVQKMKLHRTNITLKSCMKNPGCTLRNHSRSHTRNKKGTRKHHKQCVTFKL